MIRGDSFSNGAWLRRLSLLVLVCLVVASCAGPAAQNQPSAAPSQPSQDANAGPKVTVRLAMTANSANSWPIFVLQAKDFLTKQNLGIEITIIATGAAGEIAALSSRSVDVANITVDGVLSAVDVGSDAMVVAGFTRLEAYRLLAAPGITSASQLRGKVCGGTNLKTGDAFWLQAILQKAGLQYPADYSMIVTGGGATRLATLLAGQAQCTILLEPQASEARAVGATDLGSAVPALGANYQSVVLASTRSWASANKNTLVRFLKAYLQADAWLHDQANRNEAVKILGDSAARIAADSAGRTYDAWYGPKVDPSAYDVKITPNDILTAIIVQNQSGLSKVLTSDWTRYADLTYIEQAAKP